MESLSTIIELILYVLYLLTVQAVAATTGLLASNYVRINRRIAAILAKVFIFAIVSLVVFVSNLFLLYYFSGRGWHIGIMLFWSANTLALTSLAFAILVARDRKGDRVRLSKLQFAVLILPAFVSLAIIRLSNW